MEIKITPSKYDTKINLNEIIKNFFDFNWGSAVTDVININDSIETKTFWLIFKSIRETNLILTKRYGQERLDATIDLVAIARETEISLVEYLSKEVVITEDFFSNPLQHNNSYIVKAYEVFQKYCEILQIQLPINIRVEYYNTFRQTLAADYNINRTYYQDILNFFDNPIFEQNVNFGSLFEYNTSIKHFYTNKIQKDGEALETLKDLYIDPFFKIYKNNIEAELLEAKVREGRHDFYYPTESLSLHDFFNQYFFENRKHKELKADYDMVFLLGQPGQGKTSCCYKLVYDYLETRNDLPQKKIFFVKIRELMAKDFVSDPMLEISKKIPMNIDLDKEEGYLILDGLDEAFMSGGVSESDLRTLYERLKKRANKKLRIILTSRFSYLRVNDYILDNTLILHLGNLNDDQILEYSQKFEVFYPTNEFNKKIEKIIAEDKYKHIKELLQQAVLIYFIGISNIDIDEKDSKAKIYDKIFDAMALRSWDKSGQLDYLNTRMKDHPEIYKKYLREYLTNLAFEIHQSPNLHISLGHLNALESTKKFIKKCFREDMSDKTENIKEINKYLLISFYFQESNKNDTNETAIEFFHNSLFEYLTAEYFWNENKTIVLQRDEDRDLKNIKFEDYFDLLDRLVGNKAISWTIQQNLIEIVQNDSVENKRDVVTQSKDIFYNLVEHDFLLKYDRKICDLTSKDKTEQLFNLFWTFIHTANINLDDKFILPSGISSYIKEFINRDWVNMHIEVEEFFDDIYCHHMTIEKMLFKDCFLRITSRESFIEMTDFINVIFDSLDFTTSTFKKVTFQNCDFDTYKHHLYGNRFFKCIFDNVRIYDDDWFDSFIRHNEVDDETISSHSVVENRKKLQ